jgi:hypothetical protein
MCRSPPAASRTFLSCASFRSTHHSSREPDPPFSNERPALRHSVDVTAVESAFAQRLSELDRAPTDINPPNDDAATVGRPESAASQTAPPLLASERRPVLQKGIRLRDKEHRKFVASQPCLVCGRAPSDPHHLRFAQPRALGRQVSDQFTVPLCRTHHRELHRRGDETAWWQTVKIDPIPLALKLWQERQFDRTDI